MTLSVACSPSIAWIPFLPPSSQSPVIYFSVKDVSKVESTGSVGAPTAALPVPSFWIAEMLGFVKQGLLTHLGSRDALICSGIEIVSVAVVGPSSVGYI